VSRIRAIAVAAALLALSACSGEEDQDEALPPSTSALGGSNAPAEPANAFCAPADALGDVGAIPPTELDPADLREQFTEALDAVEQTEAEAPEEIRADVAVLADGYEEFYNALEAADFDITDLSLEDFTVLDTAEMTAASERVDAYRADVCG
jgi:hypothetical protein